MFWLDDALQSLIYLDGIITVVDSKFILDYLQSSESELASKQIAMADRILLNKTDLSTDSLLQQIEAHLTDINSIAQIKRTQNSVIDLNWMLNLHAFDKNQTDPFESFRHSIRPGKHIQTVGFSIHGEIDEDLLHGWVQSLLWDSPNQPFPDSSILRMKALIHLQGSKQKAIVQAVNEIYDIHLGANWESNQRENKVVIIGSNLNAQKLKEFFKHHCRL